MERGDTELDGLGPSGPIGGVPVDCGHMLMPTLTFRSLCSGLGQLLWPVALALVLGAGLSNSGCTGARDARFDAAVAREQPPADFQLGITVQAPLSTLGARAIITPARDGQPSTQTFVSNTPYGQRGVAIIPLSHRPARYVFEADWILRSAIGYGARESNFPTQTRQLTANDVQSIWTMLQGSGLLDPNHPDIVSSAPEPEEAIGRTAYIVSYQVAGLRRTLVVDAGLATPLVPTTSTSSTTPASSPTSASADATSRGKAPTDASVSVPEPDPAAEPVRELIERFASLSWQS